MASAPSVILGLTVSCVCICFDDLGVVHPRTTRIVVDSRNWLSNSTLLNLQREDSPAHLRTACITATASDFVGKLKNLIYAEARNRLKGIDTAALDADAGVAALGQNGENLSKFALQMTPTMKLGFYFPSAVKDESIHVIVQAPSLPSAGRKRKPSAGRGIRAKKTLSRPVAPISGLTAQRELTVRALYERLERYRFVLVRGTPASGKSTVAQLLAEYTRSVKLAIEQVIIDGWPQVQNTVDWSSRLPKTYNDEGSNTFIFDESQLTYWDTAFWDSFLKPIDRNSPNRVILFGSYGSPKGRVTVERSPMKIPDCNRVSLRPVDHGDRITPAGLFLLRDEFDDMVKKSRPEVPFDAGFLDYVFHATAGHAGAVHDLLEVAVRSDSYRELKRDTGEYSLETFHREIYMENLWSSLDSKGIFTCGLPELGELCQPDIAQVFRAVFCNNYVTESMLDSTVRDVLGRCFKQDWLHAIANENEETLYIFTTHLHQWFVEYYLGTKVLNPTPITEKVFSPLQSM